MHARLRLGQARGDIRQDVDLTLVVDAFLGTALVGAVLFDRELDDAFADRVVDLLVEGLRPRPPDR